MASLDAMGIEPATVETFGMGLREPYTRADGATVHGVLSYALAEAGGRRRFGCVRLPGVTAFAEHELAWSAGLPETVRWSFGRGVLLVCGSPVALWQLGQAAERSGAPVTLVASSQPDRAPSSWSSPSFWSGWERVVLVDGVSPTLRRLVLDRRRGAVEQAQSVTCPDEDAGPAGQRHVQWLTQLLSAAVPCTQGAPVGDDGAAGDFTAARISLHGGFAGGQMFYPFEVERRRDMDGGENGPSRMLYSVETIVLRSDGAVLEGMMLPAPRGTPAARRVHALTDGTRIDGPPRASAHASWSLPSIKRFIAARQAGEDPCTRPAADIVGDVRTYLASRVALPRPEDFWIVAAFVVLTHCFHAFEALPLLCVVGPKGTGKSELGAAVSALAFNSLVMGQGSAAAMVRLAGDCGGLVVLDDVESLATDGAGFGDLAQALKTGYRRATARKPLVVGGRVEVVNFFGPRMLTVTRPPDPVLLSRCLMVETGPLIEPLPAASGPEAQELRDELHALAMARAGDIAEAYGEIMLACSDRAAEIRAPLIAIATVLGVSEIVSALAEAMTAAA